MIETFMKRRYLFSVCCMVMLCCLPLSQNSKAADQTKLLTMVVMDPLAAPLSCPCVEGYAQRDYTVLAKHLETTMNCKLTVVFSESLPSALKKTGGKSDIIIGKQSVVRADSKLAKKAMKAISELTDQNGNTTQYGMIVVNKEDPAKSVADLNDYTIIFGPSEAEEKHSAALQLLKAANVHIPTDRQKIDEACSDGACKVIDLGPESKTAAVISSYAQPLLEGCGTIKKGDLRVVGKTIPVPFVTVFVADSLDIKLRQQIATALGDAAIQPTVLQALESLAGFVPLSASTSVAKKN
ncbi:MAG: PhnD/SsuA/transferrin family substrate-binding protein [Rubripirellula sp.]|jgi:ABC-type phosphate/phosphonate transport system substrate-binding protein